MLPLTSDPLVRHCIVNLEDLFDTLVATPEKIGDTCEHYRHLRTPGPEGVWPNRVYGLVSPPQDTVAIANEIATGMRDRLLPRELCVEQVDDMHRWNEPLEAAGVTLRWDFPSMALAVENCRHDRAAVCDLNPVITPVRNEDDLREWARLIALGWWQGKDVHARLLADLYRPFLQGDSQPSLWLVRAAGAPVATGMLHITGDVAGVYLVYVDTAFRNRGLGGYVSAQMVRKGEERGCRWAILQATPEGEPVYRRLGFEVVFRNRIYWLPAND
ncbi:MAG: GNAT family N-acetyltransferase [Candidatus Cloacimonetes bacterium]|nr:GNAT family N-acetyltransferase [Candidatus Cloacimonadota bacterium]